MSVLGKWRIVKMPDYTDDYPNMIEPAYILFERTRGEFAFGCVTGAFAGGGDHDAVEFDWHGNDEMDDAAATDGPSYNLTAPSSAKSASTAATKSPSPHADRPLLQQPARASRARPRRGQKAARSDRFSCQMARAFGHIHCCGWMGRLSLERDEQELERP
jgi:hypothetical protein